jgi:lysophospholipase L1-like esterase
MRRIRAGFTAPTLGLLTSALMALRRATARWLLALGVLTGLLLAAEVVLRSTGWLRDPQEFEFRRATTAMVRDDRGRYRRHDVRFYSLAPGYHHSPSHLGREATGDWPFRGRPPQPAPPGLLRLAIVGDSCVYGVSLDACDLLGSRLAGELAARGLPPDRVAVLSLGVPGYSTEQLAPLLDETLDELHPDVVVIYPAAWNDQAPAVHQTDHELLESLQHATVLDWIVGHSRVAAALWPLDADPSPQQAREALKSGRLPFAFRVPAEQVGPNVAGMLRRCAQAGVPAVVIAPPHLPRTLDEHPRTAVDAAAVLDAARQAGVPALDGQRLLATGEDPALLFTDGVHPAPAGIARLATALAEAVAPALRAAQARRAAELPAPAAPLLQIRSVEPRASWTLGDGRLRVTLDGWSRDEALPAVIVGGAPLLELRAVDEATVEGTLIANGPGLHELIVQTERGCAWLPDAVELRDLELEVAGSSLVVHGRAGDRLQLFVATRRRAAPAWSIQGAAWLADAQPLGVPLLLDATGRAETPLSSQPAGGVIVQALLAPPGEMEADNSACRWTAPVELTLGG